MCNPNSKVDSRVNEPLGVGTPKPIGFKENCDPQGC